MKSHNSRRTVVKSSIMLLCLIPLLVSASGISFQAKVIGVVDGDTIDVLKDQQKIRIRLAEIDCPESHQAYGTAAKQFTAQMVFGKKVIISPHKQDRYGRTIADVHLPDGTNLNEELVKAGLAWVYTAYSHNPYLLSLQAKAQEQHLGLWAASDTPIPPWEFRKNRSTTRGPTGHN